MTGEANGSATNGNATRPANASPVELESAIARVQGVRGVQVVLGSGRITDVHVLATRERSPKQIVRDVQSVVQAGFDFALDYRAVSVVQLDGDDVVADAGRPEAVPAPARAVLAALNRFLDPSNAQI